MQNQSVTPKERLMIAKDIYCAYACHPDGPLTQKQAIQEADEFIAEVGFVTESCGNGIGILEYDEMD